VFDQDRFGHYGTDTALPCSQNQCDEQVNRKNDNSVRYQSVLKCAQNRELWPYYQFAIHRSRSRMVVTHSQHPLMHALLSFSILRCRLSIPAYHLSIPDNRLSIPAYHLSISDNRLSIPAYHLLIPEDHLFIPIYRLSIPEDNLSILGYRLSIPEYGLSIPGDHLLLPQFHLSISGCVLIFPAFVGRLRNDENTFPQTLLGVFL
jgi:hypothetical protein